jgi:hypothetical protein
VVEFRRTFRVSLPPLITVFYHPVFMLSGESVYCGTILCSLFVPSSVSRRDDIIYASLHHSFVPNLDCQDLQSNPKVGCIIRLFMYKVML